MNYKYKSWIRTFSLASLMLPLACQADVKLEPTLEKVAAKVDTDGTYLQLNKFDGDISAFVEYGELLLNIGKQLEGLIPQNLKVEKLVQILGIDQMQASAASAKKIGGFWNNKLYLWTSGSEKGVLSIYGAPNERIEVAEFAPETTDIALQLRINFSQLKKMASQISEEFGMKEEMEKEMNKSWPEIGGMTPFGLLEKLNFRANLALDIDRAERIPLPGGFEAPGLELVARMDDGAWAWKLFGSELLKQSQLPWKEKKEGEVLTYSLPAEMADSLMGYSPVIRVDGKNVWIASKAPVLAAALQGGKKLKDGAQYLKTMESLPKTGNSIAYFSSDLLAELVQQYKNIGAQRLSEPNYFKMIQPVTDKLIADFTNADSGIVALIQKDEQGISSILRAPLPLKNYIDKIAPALQSATMSSMFGAQMDVGEINEEEKSLPIR